MLAPSAGYSDDEVSGLGDLSLLTPDQIQELVRKKSMQMLGLNNGNHQKIIPIGELKNHITEGWEFVRELPNNEAIIKLPNH